MFEVGHVLVTDELLDAPFACNLSACLGGCCVQGDSGAPLEDEERQRLEEALPRVWKDLRPRALETIAQHGVWEETEPSRYATTCVDDAECVFVIYEGPVAKCALQKAHQEGRIDFPKPISCHLYPVRIKTYGSQEVINYEKIPLCDPARKHGCRTDVQLADFLREPLTRKYGPSWYETFRQTLQARRKALGRGAAPQPQRDEDPPC